MAEVITIENFHKYKGKKCYIPDVFDTESFFIPEYIKMEVRPGRTYYIMSGKDSRLGLNTTWSSYDERTGRWELYQESTAVTSNTVPSALSEGTKHDDGKPPIGLIPYCALEETARCFGFGAKKYATFNFTKGLKVTRCLDAAQRHIGQALWIEEMDEESQCMHLGCAMAEIAMAIFMIKNKKEFDDRYIKQEVNK